MYYAIIDNLLYDKYNSIKFYLPFFTLQPTLILTLLRKLDKNDFHELTNKP